jgi:pimeloyl-ACP methyl ester carboxylesterase
MLRVLLWIVGILAVLIGLAFAFLGDPEVPRDLLMQKYGQAPSQFVDLPSGAKAHYRDQGNKAGAALVLLHGSNASLHTWEPWVKILGDEFRVVTVDLPGHGLTIARADDELTSESMAAFVDEFATAIGIQRFAIGGNSMGGSVSGRYAMKYPDRLTHLILVDGGNAFPPDMPEPPAFFYLVRTPVLRDFLRLIPGRPVAEATLKASFVNHALVTPEMIDRYWELNRGPGIRMATRKRFSVGLEYFQAEDKFARENLPKLTVPTLVMWGRQDKLIPVSAAELHAKLIPGAQLKIYDAGGHILQEDLAEQSAADVRAFLKAQPAGAEPPPAATAVPAQ